MFVANLDCAFDTFKVNKEWKTDDGVLISDHYGISLEVGGVL
jgi:hypothetical protein